MNKANVTALRDLMMIVPPHKLWMAQWQSKLVLDDKGEIQFDTRYLDKEDLADPDTRYDYRLNDETAPNLCSSGELLAGCGTCACVAGWTATLPEFKAQGGRVGNQGGPEIDRNIDTLTLENAVAYWLDIPYEVASQMCYTNGSENSVEFYGVDTPEDISPDVVVAKLNEILKDNSLVYDNTRDTEKGW